jgi:FlgD Ig-like domain
LPLHFGKYYYTRGTLARVASAVLVLALLGGTATAFAVTESLKLERSPVAAPRIDKVFSPVCDCKSETARIRFRLREADRLTVAIVSGGDVVRTLVRSQPERAGGVEYEWDGRDDGGRVVPEGSYRPRVHLAEQRRTIVFPNPIEVDITPPRVRVVSAAPATISPDGDGRSDRVQIRYRVSENAHGLLFVDGRRTVYTRFQPREGVMSWYATRSGRSARPGRYRLEVAAEDTAGNLSTGRVAFPVRVRYIELARESIRAKARTRFGIRVDTDARSYLWLFAGRTGRSSARLLVLRAPKAGRYRLFVEANRHGDSARVIVSPRGR